MKKIIQKLTSSRKITFSIRLFIRILYAIAVVLVAFIIIFRISLHKYNSILIEHRKNDVRSYVNICYRQIKPIVDQYETGQITRESALQRSQEIIRNTWYSGDLLLHYVFVNGMDGTSLLHPLKNSRNTFDDPALRGLHNSSVVNDFVDIARSEDREGFTTYFFPPGNTDKSARKIAFIKAVPPLEIFIGSAISLNDIYEKTGSIFREILLYMGIVFMFVIAIVFLFLNPYLNILARMIQAFEQISTNIFAPVNLDFERYKKGSARRFVLESFNNLVESFRSNMRELQASEERFRVLFEYASDGMILFTMKPDNTLMIANLNRTACKMHGYSKEELIGKPASVLNTLITRSNQKENLARMELGEKIILESSNTRKDGTSFQVEISAHRILLDELNYIFAIIRDISYRRQIESQLEESEQQMKILFENSRDGIVIITRDGRIININDAAIQMTGYTREEMNQIQLIELAYDRSNLNQLIRKLISQGSINNFEFELLTKEKQVRVVEVSATMQRDMKGKAHTFQGILRDITVQRSLEEQLRQSQKLEAVGKLASGIAHDFNNILTIILGNAELVLMTIPEDSPVREDIHEIKKSGEGAAKLVSQLLAYSRKQVINPESLNLNELLDNLHSMIQRLIGENIKLTHELCQNPCLIEADKNQVEQVILNLVINSRDAIMEDENTDKPKIITIETRKMYLDEEFTSSHLGSSTGNHIMLKVNDSGVGIDEHNVNKIFDPFFSTKKQQGTGLGLSSVYGIVKQHRGSIFVESKKNVGTSITIYWPCSESEGKLTADFFSQSGSFHGKESLLVVEDDDKLRRITVNALEFIGYSVYQAGSGSEALDLIEKHGDEIDIVFSDIVLPDFDGLVMADKIMKDKPGMRILFTSGYPLTEKHEGNVHVSSRNFIQKPFSMSELAMKIRHLLDR